MRNSCIILKAGTRQSRLALLQAEEASSLVRRYLPALKIELAPMSSPGDRDKTSELVSAPQNFFTKDLDDALLKKQIDMAFHSAKDLPDSVHPELDWFYLPGGASSQDTLVLRQTCDIKDLPPNPRIGTSSERRSSWIPTRFPGARLLPVRGTIDERLAQLDRGDFDALIIAAAALERLGMKDRITMIIPASELQPPEGQGRLAVTFRQSDERILLIRNLLLKPVCFVGAGVSPDTMTVLGAALLNKADICLHDKLIPDGILKMSGIHTRLIDCGRRSGQSLNNQELTNTAMLNWFKKGFFTVRLKAGDPGTFGRLTEETEFLEAHSVPFHVTPGVSSISAATTGTGLILTARGAARGFTAMSPREAGGAFAPVNNTSRKSLPLVLLMGSESADLIAEDLIKNDDVPPSTPVEIIMSAGRHDQLTASTTLDQLARKIEEMISSSTRKQHPPTIIIVGRTARPVYKDFSPLAHRTVIITCSETLQAKATLQTTLLGGHPAACPMIKVELNSTIIPKLENAGFIMLTSPSSVKTLQRAVAAHPISPASAPVFICYAENTANACRAAFPFSKIITMNSVAPDSKDWDILRNAFDGKATVLRIKSNLANPGTTDLLSKCGASAEDCELYTTSSVHYDSTPEGDCILFTSSSAVRSYIEQFGADSLGNKCIVVLGSKTASTIKDLARTPDVISPAHDVEQAMIALAGRFTEEKLQDL